MAHLNYVISENNCYIVPTKSPIVSDKRKINYPVMRINGRPVKTRKLVYEECFGPIPEGCLLSSNCLNPRCINPEHLFVITREQNTENLAKARKNKKETDLSIPYKMLSEEDKRLAKVLLKTKSTEEVAAILQTTPEGLISDLNSPF